MEAHETHEVIHETAHHHHGDPVKTSRNKKIAILISVLAALLALTEACGKNAQNRSLIANIHANDMWSFFQAKTIRMGALRTAADTLELGTPADLPPAKAEAVAKRVADWRAQADRYDSDPNGGDGRKELMAKAKEDEASRDLALSAYHQFEYGAAALQIGIVLCSASVVTDMIVLAFVAGGLGVLGVGFALLGVLAPTLVHF